MNQEDLERLSSFAKLHTIKEEPGSHLEVTEGDEASHFFAPVARYRSSLGVIMANGEADKCLCRGSDETLSAGIDWTDNRGRQLFGHVDHVGYVDPRTIIRLSTKPEAQSCAACVYPDMKRDASAMSK